MTVWFLAAISVAAPSDGWNNLKHVTRDRPYAVILRDKQCQYGTLSSVGEQALVLATYTGLGVLIKRSQIARVTDNPTEPTRGAVFSARSSWLDVKAAAPKTTEYLHIVTKGGEEWKWKKPTVSNDSITFEQITVGKAEVRYVSYVRFKPLTVEEEFFHQEDLSWLASIPWVSDLVSRKISVLLYNSDVPEDNSAIACR
ncbi:MAG TPA: hypothetical protein VEV85_22515 [Bryobacteraceae bacterium]|nr:hypothetical protein [Bryobacteraceae bacterium]